MNLERPPQKIAPEVKKVATLRSLLAQRDALTREAGWTRHSFEAAAKSALYEFPQNPNVTEAAQALVAGTRGMSVKISSEFTGDPVYTLGLNGEQKLKDAGSIGVQMRTTQEGINGNGRRE